MTNRHIPTAVVTAVLLLPGGCGPALTPDPLPAPTASALAEPTLAVGAKDVVTGTEIASAPAGSAFDLLRRLRPEFLRRRAVAVMGDPYNGFPAVYLEQRPLGGVDELRGIQASMLAEVRYLGPTAAYEWLGVHHPGGAIVLRPRR